MKFSEFKNKVLNKQVSSLYLFEGEEVFFSERGIELLKSTLLTEPDLNFITLGESVSADDIIASASAFPVFDNKRLTLLREFYPDEKTLKVKLGQFFQTIPSDSIIIIANTRPHAPIKKLASVTVVECEKPEPSVVARWVKEQCAQNNVGIDLETARLVGEYCLFSMTRVEKETEKLIAFAKDGSSITKKDVDALIARDTEYKIYELTDLLAKKKIDKAIEVINEMLSKGESYQRLLVSVQKFFSRLLHISISDKKNSELASLLGIKEYAVIKAREQAKMFKVKSLKKAVDMFADCDYKTKTGELSETSAFFMCLFKILVG